MVPAANKYEKSKFFDEERDVLLEGASEDEKVEYEDFHNGIDWEEFYRDEHPEMKHPYKLWNGEIIDKDDDPYRADDENWKTINGNHVLVESETGEIKVGPKALKDTVNESRKAVRSVRGLMSEAYHGSAYKKADQARVEAFRKYEEAEDRLHSIPSRLPEEKWSDEEREFVETVGKQFAPINPEWTEAHKESESAYDEWHKACQKLNRILLNDEPAPHLKDFQKPVEVKEKKDFEGFEFADTGTSLDLKGAILTEMPPEEYLKRCAAMFNDTDGKKTNLTMQVRQLNRESIDDIKGKIQNGVKMYTPWLDERGINGQEGRHRAAAAYELGIKTIPVIYWKRENHDSRMDDDGWVTINGTHVLIDEEGNAKGGGKLNGMKFTEAKSQKKEKSASSVLDDDGLMKAAGESDNEYEFWMNLTPEQQKQVGKNYKDIYSKLKEKVGDTKSEWADIRGNISDMPTKMEKPDEPVKVEFKSSNGTHTASANDNNAITLYKGHEHEWNDEVFVHELGHQLSNFGLGTEILANPGGLWGRYNQKQGAFYGPGDEFQLSPEESFADCFRDYIIRPERLKAKSKDVYDYFQRLEKDNPWVRDYVDKSLVNIHVEIEKHAHGDAVDSYNMDDENWKTINGTHVLIDKETGVMTGGPQALKDINRKRIQEQKSGSEGSGSFDANNPERYMTAFKVSRTGYEDADDFEEFQNKNLRGRDNPNRIALTKIYKEGGIEAVMQEYFGMKTIASTKGVHQVSKDEADEIMFDEMGQGVFDGWFREANSEYKPRVVSAVIRNTKARSAALSIMYLNYQYETGGNLSFEEFLVTPIKMYRGGRGQKHIEDDVFSSYSLSRKVAEKFAGNDGKIYEAEIRPIDTWGSVKTTGESEILVPSWIAPNGNTDSVGVSRLDGKGVLSVLELQNRFAEINKNAYNRKNNVANGNGSGIIIDETRLDADNRLAFGLCKEYGIELPKGAEPKDAWEALKNKTGKSPKWFYKHPGEKATTKEEEPKKAEETKAEPEKVEPEKAYVPELLKREEGGLPVYSDETWKFLATGAVSFNGVNFKQAKLEEHKKKHGPKPDGDGTYTAKEVQNMTQMARDLLSKPVGGNIDGYVRTNGMIVRYNKDTNEYAAGLPGKKIHTIHKLNEPHEIEVDGKKNVLMGYSYFLHMKAEQEKK